MKKLFSILVLSVFLLLAIKAYADITIYGNGTQKGRVENVNVKGGATSKTGQTGLIDITALNGVNWAAVGLIQGASINWGSINPTIANSGINWNDIQQAQMSKVGINWNSLDTSSGGVNWTAYAGTAVNGQLVCWNTTNGRLGHCAVLSGTVCTTCI